MSTLSVLQSLKESILSQASVKAIYGEPIAAQGKMVIPVARIMYDYGGGSATGGVGGRLGNSITSKYRFPYVADRRRCVPINYLFVVAT
jgi:uncharacterized spore protein YtfJ